MTLPTIPLKLLIISVALAAVLGIAYLWGLRAKHKQLQRTVDEVKAQAEHLDRLHQLKSPIAQQELRDELAVLEQKYGDLVFSQAMIDPKR